jgi:hypothetical protein
MPVKLTESAKKLRGTHRKSRVLVPRTLERIQSEILETEGLLGDIRFNLGLALDSIRKRGLTVKTVVLDSHGKPVKVEKINPALKIQREAVSSISSLKRQLVNLREEESLAAAKVSEEDFSEFE